MRCPSDTYGVRTMLLATGKSKSISIRDGQRVCNPEMNVEIGLWQGPRGTARQWSAQRSTSMTSRRYPQGLSKCQMFSLRYGLARRIVLDRLPRCRDAPLT